MAETTLLRTPGGPAADLAGGPSDYWRAAGLVLLLGAAIFAMRLAAPPNLLDQDQERPAAYVLDAVKNGHWLCQSDLQGDITSKPPVWTWLSALVTLVTGRLTVFSLYLPGALAAVGTALLILSEGRKWFGLRSALIAAISVMLCSAGVKAFGLARTDSVFTFTVAATALLAWRSWTRGTGWTWFWLMAAVSTLTKGPLGPLLGATGLLAALWERRSGSPLPLRGKHTVGLLLFLGISAGWLLLSWYVYGDPVRKRILGEELADQSVGLTEGIPGTKLYQPLLFYIARAIPWSLAACYGAWRLWKHPATDLSERRFERFLFCWFVGGLLALGLASHQRGDLVWPVIPAGALLAGREIVRWTSQVRPSVFCSAAVAVVLLAFSGYTFYYFGPSAGRSPIPETAALEKLAADLEHNGGKEFPLVHVDTPMAFQAYLNTLRPLVGVQDAASLLRGPESAFVAVSDLERLQKAIGPNGPPSHILLQSDPRLKDRVYIVSNRQALENAGPFAFIFGDIHLRAFETTLLGATEGRFRLRASKKGNGTVLLTNRSDKPSVIRVACVYSDRSIEFKRALNPGEAWKLDL